MEIRTCPGCETRSAKDVGVKWDYQFVTCNDCGTLFTKYEPPAGLEQDYSEYSYGDTESIPEFIHARCDELIRPFEPYRKINSFLDIGFGAGTMLKAASRAGWNVSGVEVSVKAVDVLGRDFPDFDLFAGPVESSGYADNSFDAVSLIEVIEHVLDPRPLLRKARDLVRPGGVVWVTTPNLHSLSSRLLQLDWSMVAPPDHLEIYSVKGLKLLMLSCGLRIEKIETFGINPHEIITYFKNGRKEVAVPERSCSAYELNEKMESSRSRQFLKRTANAILNFGRSGDGTKIWATKD